MSHALWFYQLCYCTICVKGNGSTGAGINLGGEKASLKVQGEEHVAKYNPRISEKGAAEKKVRWAGAPWGQGGDEVTEGSDVRRLRRVLGVSSCREFRLWR